MKDKLNDLLRQVAKSSCTPQEFEAIAMRIEDIKREIGIYWFKHPVEIPSQDFIIAANQSDNAPVKL